MRRFLFLALCQFLFWPLCASASEDASANVNDDAVSTPSGGNKAAYRKISAEEEYQMMRDTQGYILLDVRTVEEFEERHIEGAVLIPDYEIRSRAENDLPDKSTLILIYCRSGRRSANAAEELVHLGYGNVYDFGGILDWPYDTVSGN